MAKRESKRVGSGITERTVEHLVLSPDDPADREAIEDWFAGLVARLDEPWGANAELIADAVRGFEEIEASLVGATQEVRRSMYQERESPAWYIREIAKTARAVELAIEGGRPWEAANRAMLIGELITEFRLKKWDAPASHGLKMKQKNSEGGRNCRKRPDSERVAAVLKYKNKNLSEARAIYFASEELGDSEGIIGKAYYAYKKLSNQ